MTDGTLFRGLCRDAGKSKNICLVYSSSKLTWSSIVEYATREQAQQAVNTLSNQNLMGRLVYVREVCRTLIHSKLYGSADFSIQDREAEPRFTGPPAGGRGGYEGGAGRGGFAGGFGGGMGAGGGAGGGRQIYVSNVCLLQFPL